MIILGKKKINKEDLLKHYGGLKIVTSVNGMINSFESYKRYDVFGLFGVTLTLYLNLLFCDFQDIWVFTATQLSYGYYFITMMVSMALIYQIYKVFNSKSIVDVYKEIIHESISGDQPTAVFIIKHQSEGKNKMLVQRGSWGCYFLPYYKYDVKRCIEDQIDIMEKNLAEKIGLPHNSVKIEYLSHMDTKSIKRYKPNNDERLFEYKFFFVEINPVNYYKITTTKIGTWEWKTLEELQDDGTTMAYNSDIINYLKESNCIESHSISKMEKPLLNKPIKIIWNLTNKCPYQCDICAVNSDTINSEAKELSQEEKIKALVSISTIKDYIKEIDFAGGDPLAIQDDRDIIKYARCIFNKDVISVSTTGKTLRNLSNYEIESLFNTCDLTYDFPYSMEKIDPRKSDYNYMNYKEAKRLSEMGVNINIQIPIQPANNNVNIIKTIIKDIKEITPKSITLLRYMPVGRVDYEKYLFDTTYNPGEFINNFKSEMQKLNYNVELKLQCALRVKYSDDYNNNYCNMFSEKIGIDHLGNVYLCAWGGNIKCENNSFYIGNIINQDLKDLLIDDKRINSLRNKLSEKRRSCSVFAYLSANDGNDDNLFICNDPLIN